MDDLPLKKTTLNLVASLIETSIVSLAAEQQNGK